MKKKVNLEKLKVSSFVTHVESEKENTIKGGDWPTGSLTLTTQTLIGPQCQTNLCNITRTCPPATVLCTYVC